MECHSRVLCGALNQPVQRESLVDFIAKRRVAHLRTRALGSGVGRVLGHSGLNGSNSRLGFEGGALGWGAGFSRGVLGGATGAV